MRSLLVLPESSPLPRDRGLSIRAWNLASALGDLGELDVVLVGSADDAECRALEAALGAGTRVCSLGFVPRPWRRTDRIRWLVASRLPLYLFRLGIEGAADAASSWLQPSYSVAVYQHMEAFLALSGRVQAPGIVDIDNLPSVLAERTFDVERMSRPRSPTGWFHNAMRQVDVRRSQRLERLLRDSNELLVVCSENDRRTLSGDRVEVVPNGCEIPEAPVGRVEVSTGPTMLLLGRMSYRPNSDAASVLVEEILPLVRREIPDVRCLIAGHADAGERAQWETHPGVLTTGYVPDVDQVLRQADLVTVPLRSGGGTRLKILEAFAQRIPVVATPVGAEGIEVKSGKHLLLADSPDAFAAACISLLRDEDLRSEIADHAYALVRDRYDWRDIRSAFGVIAQRWANEATGLPSQLDGGADAS